MPVEDTDFAAVDAALGEWQQGDAFLGSIVSFVHVADLARPLTELARDEAAAGIEEEASLTSIGSPVPGFVVISQTCDVISRCDEHPFVQIAGLRQVDATFAKQVRGGYRPRFAFIPGLDAHLLVADLDLLMTVEKSVLMTLAKSDVIRGVRDDVEARAFAECLSRRFARFAFPDDFVRAVTPIQARIKDKHNKNSSEGRAYSSIREIRVSAVPAWNTANPRIEFIFVLNSDQQIEQNIEAVIEQLVTRFQPTGVFGAPAHRIVALHDMSAALYLSTDRLDLDHLSRRSHNPGE